MCTVQSVSHVFFGLKTRISGTLQQIVVLHGDYEFDIPVSRRRKGKPRALGKFINILECIPNPVLVGHNTQAFQCRVLRDTMKNHNVSEDVTFWEKFIEIVKRCVDTSPLFREEYPKQKELKIRDLAKLYDKNVSATGENLLAEVKILQEISLLNNSKVKHKFSDHDFLMRSVW